MTTALRLARWGVGASLPLLGALTLLSGAPARAASVGPSAIGWFDVTAQSGAPAVPQPDVPAGGGLVAGVDPAGTPLPTVGAPDPTSVTTAPTTTAVTALRFALPSGTSASQLTLALGSTSSNAAGLTVLACRTTSPWNPGDQQAGSGPTRDCANSSLGAVAGSTVVFSDIGQLQQGAVLDFVLVPSTAGRLIIDPPDANSLQTIDVGTASTTPVFTAPYHAPTTTASSVAPVAKATTPSRVAAPRVTTQATQTPLAAVVPPTSAAPPAQAPAASVALPTPAARTYASETAPGAAPVAGGVASGAITPPGVSARPLQAAASIEALRTHRGALLLALLLLLAVAVVLFLIDPDSQTGRVGEAVSALRGRPSNDVARTTMRGLGRHRSERSGTAPRL